MKSAKKLKIDWRRGGLKKDTFRETEKRKEKLTYCSPQEYGSMLDKHSSCFERRHRTLKW